VNRLKQREEIRQEMRKVVGNLDRRWILAASHHLCAHLTHLLDEIVETDVEHLLAWIPYFPGEVDLSSLISEQLSRRKIYLPRAMPDYSMEFISIDDRWLHAVSHGLHGIPEPNDESAVRYDCANAGTTAVIVPGLAFDRDGNRLGRGKGYYDRFLSRSGMQNAFKIGVCWELQVVQEFPIESHDVPMDYLCHERDLIRTGVAFDDDLEE